MIRIISKTDEDYLKSLIKQRRYLKIAEEKLSEENIKLEKLYEKGLFDFLKKMDNSCAEDISEYIAKVIKPEDIKEKYIKIINRINKYLGLDEPYMPELEYFKTDDLLVYKNRESRLNSYEITRQRRISAKARYQYAPLKIILSDMLEEDLPRLVSHEYAHHLQTYYIIGHKEPNIEKNKYFNDKMNGKTAFVEGHAQGIESIISQLYALEEDNHSFLFMNVNSRVNRLQNIYLYLSKYHNQRTKTELLNKVTIYDPQDKRREIRLSSFFPRSTPSELTVSEIGLITFLGLENRFGPEIYKQLLTEYSNIIKKKLLRQYKPK